MKKNLGLLGILVTLLLVTYFFQEKKLEKNFVESFTRDRLINETDIQKLTFLNVEAEKKDGQWWAGNQLLSHNSMKVIERKLSQIKKLKEIQGDPSHYFTEKLEVTVNGELWKLGDLTLDRQGFYLSKGPSIMVATIEGENGELTGDPEKLLLIKYDELKRGLNSSLQDLRETQLFRYYPKLPLKTVTIESDGRPSFELELESNQTLPGPFPGIEVHDKIGEKFLSLLTQMMIKEEIPYAKVKKFSRLGQIKFSSGKENLTWELWLSGEKSADAHIVDHQQKRAWLMIGGTLKLFFVGVQDFWDKKVIPPSQFEHFSKLKVTFTQGEKSTALTVLNREPLAFEGTGFKVDVEKMNILFQYIFNLSEKDQAQRVSPLSKSERKEVLSGDFLRAEVMGQELVFWRKQQELILVNLTQGFKAHFLIADESFRARFEDVLK
jgi:hypothetical protein